MPDLFDNITNWLLGQALGDDDISVTLGGLAMRLKDGGIPIARIGMGRSLLHPVIGLIDMQWNSDTGHVQFQTVPRKALSFETFEGSPFGDIALGKVEYIIADLKDPDEVKRYAIFEKLANEGVTSYAAFVRKFGHLERAFPDNKGNTILVRGVNVSFATRRFSGFTQSDIDGLERLVSALCVCTRVDNDRFLVKEMLKTYLGSISGGRVLAGQVERGDGEKIDCAILYSDLRGSVALSQELDTQQYLDTVNAYFDCTVNAVSDHGGEVLKLIGDGVLAIFPFEGQTRPRENMCAAALASAREAFARANHVNKSRTREALPEISFGVSLHVGKVIYGNVGTEKRMDFTATGPAVGLAARVEALTRVLEAPLLATKVFADLCSEASVLMPAQTIKDFADPVELVRFEI